ncbi:MAG TPA: DUF2442 domain-containing protein [Bacillota bacterium]|nr:DUF2442 domain-containing protein [Bacillota bacterium]HOR86478.1 DUF2442 domain-containing protein [Bacillota bacterium]HPL53166.1 DUF2442 domain-containing protein [Bacillota bacterium]
MSYIKTVLPMKGYRLFMEMKGGSAVIVDFSNKLHTVKYAELAEEAFFRTAATDGDYVIWDDGRLRLTVNELMEVVLLG